MADLVDLDDRNNVVPPFAEYEGQSSFFGGTPPLPVGVGYGVVLGFGILFSLITTALVYMVRRVVAKDALT